MHVDQIEVEILQDGMVKVSTDKISAPNHLNCDQLLQYLATLLGGTTQSQPKAQAHRHGHHGQHTSH